MTMTGSSRQLTGHPARVISLLFTCNPFLFLFTKYLQASTNKWIFLCCLHLEPRWDNWENMHEYWEFKENVLPLADLLHLWMCFSYWLKLNINGSHIYIHLSWHSCFSVRMYTYEFYIQFLLQFTNYWPMQLASRTVQMYTVYHFVKFFSMFERLVKFFKHIYYSYGLIFWTLWTHQSSLLRQFQIPSCKEIFVAKMLVSCEIEVPFNC